MIKKLLFGAMAAAAVLLPASAQAEGPEIGTFDGYYSFESEDFELIDSNYADYFKADFDFQIESFWYTDTLGNEHFSTTIVNDFLYNDLNLNAEYDMETGLYSIRVLTIKPEGTYLGIAPAEGGWKGMSALTGNLLSFTIEEDGTITIPDFNIITFSGMNQTGVVASYKNIRVTSTDAPEIDGPEFVSFAGTYPLKGVKYEYPNGTGREPVVTPLNFNLVINENNQITSIGGYTLDKEQIEVNKRNQGVVSGNQLILEAAPFVGVQWEMVGVSDESSGFMEAYLLGGPDIYGYNQLSPTNKIVFTREEDGTYYLAPFTLWYRHQITNEAENLETVFDLVFKWEQTDASSGVEMAGVETAAPRYYNLQGVEIKNPERGSICIKVEGSGAKLVKF